MMNTTFTAFFDSVSRSIDGLSLISWMDCNGLKCQLSLEMISSSSFRPFSFSGNTDGKFQRVRVLSLKA